ncbi:hypothetical protein [Mycobacterium basiliense]
MGTAVLTQRAPQFDEVVERLSNGITHQVVDHVAHLTQGSGVRQPMVSR